jgi:uncharacterized membrane protein YfcA
MFDWHFILWATFTFLLGGVVKGVIGSGLPTIAVGVLTAVIGLHPAMALMLAPTIVTNAWQAVVGGHLRAVLARVWPFLLTGTVTIWLGAMALTRVNVHLLSGLLGFLLAAYGAFSLFARPPAIARERQTLNDQTWINQTWIGVVAGFFNGIFGGMTGSFGVPGIPYLQAIGLRRDELIQALGILFTLSTISLSFALRGQNLLSLQLGFASVLAVIPAIAGMLIGQRLRKMLSEARFRAVFLTSQIALGLYIMLRAAM